MTARYLGVQTLQHGQPGVDHPIAVASLVLQVGYPGRLPRCAILKPVYTCSRAHYSLSLLVRFSNLSAKAQVRTHAPVNVGFVNTNARGFGG